MHTETDGLQYPRKFSELLLSLAFFTSSLLVTATPKQTYPPAAELSRGRTSPRKFTSEDSVLVAEIESWVSAGGRPEGVGKVMGVG